MRISRRVRGPYEGGDGAGRENERGARYPIVERRCLLLPIGYSLLHRLDVSLLELAWQARILLLVALTAPSVDATRRRVVRQSRSHRARSPFCEAGREPMGAKPSHVVDVVRVGAKGIPRHVEIASIPKASRPPARNKVSGCIGHVGGNFTRAAGVLLSSAILGPCSHQPSERTAGYREMEHR